MPHLLVFTPELSIIHRSNLVKNLTAVVTDTLNLPAQQTSIYFEEYNRNDLVRGGHILSSLTEGFYHIEVHTTALTTDQKRTLGQKLTETLLTSLELPVEQHLEQVCMGFQEYKPENLCFGGRLMADLEPAKA